MTLFEEATALPEALSDFINKVRIGCRTYDCDNCPIGKVLGNKRCSSEVIKDALTAKKQRKFR